MLRSLTTVGSHTLLSRVLGFVRDLVLARLFGANAQTDAFFIAFKIPNFFRRLFAEGAFATAFTPILMEYKSQHDEHALQQFINAVAGSLGLVLLAVALLGIIAAPLFISLFAFGWVLDARTEQINLAVTLLRLTFPYLFFISLTAFAGSILNAHGRFAVPAFTPVLLNLCLIAAALWLSPHLEPPIMALAWGVLIAGMVQLSFQLPFLCQIKRLPRPRLDWQHEGLKRVLKLMLPALFAVSVVQINLLLDTLLASFLQAGSISWLYYSDRLMELPLGVLGVALATVILPRLSEQYAQQDQAAFRRSLDWGLRMALLFGLPAALGLISLALPIIATLFLSDQFSVHDALMAERSLIAYACGLLFFILIKVLAPAYYAQQDTKTPVKIGVIAMIANMGFNLVLIWPLQHAGLALATSLSAVVNAGLLFKGLQHRLDATWKRFAYQIILANALMLSFLWWMRPKDDFWLGPDLSSKILYLAALIITAILIYFISLWSLGMRLRQRG